MAPIRYTRGRNQRTSFPTQSNMIISGPSLFAHSRNIVINGGNFTAGNCCGGHPEVNFGVRNLPEIPRYQVRTQDIIGTRDQWTFSVGEADARGRKSGQAQVIIQTFEGPRAREDWLTTIRYAQRLVNPHVLEIVGISPTSVNVDYDPHYILFDGGYRSNTHRLLALGLRQGEKEITMLGLRIVYGIAVQSHTLAFQDFTVDWTAS
ncbi:hypothetical protein GYMLUDRAFT_43644 [Collybiopsis luxurians FD-317 M1]|uniref:Uncharacterized protein n=1 Tax=Collybiopsis luxurians FD-317 M1 TaxID=944289 RepID=A0A0D0CNL6_9AGAR|nr:hypothetical protein GYMLUDRAFT_43644 [Collybiopsis luxurians FD-317 M1]